MCNADFGLSKTATICPIPTLLAKLEHCVGLYIAVVRCIALIYM